MSKPTINARTIVEYRTNQKKELFAHSKLNKNGFPELWPTRNSSNQAVFISFVDAQIFDLEGYAVDEEKVTFDILDADEYDPSADKAERIVKYVSALLDPKFRVKGGVYFNGEYYTGQMKRPLALKLYRKFMHKYFHIEDREIIEKYFSRDERGYFPFWPIKSRTKRIIFSAVNASINDVVSKQQIREDVNFDLEFGKLLNLNKKEDKIIADTIFALLSEKEIVRGFYYKGELIPNKVNDKIRRYLTKTFVKKNFAIEDIDYVTKNTSIRSKNGGSYFFPMRDKSGRPVIASFRNGITPLGEKYANFDIYSDEVFDPRDKKNQDYVRIIEGIITREKGFEGDLYLDGVLVPAEETDFEVERRKAKVEKALQVRIDGDPDYLKIFNTFTTNDREKLLLLCDYNRNLASDGSRRYPHKNEEFKEIPLAFLNVNILDEKGHFIFKKHLNHTFNSVDEVKDLNDEEIRALCEAFRKMPLSRGGIYIYGRNANRMNNFILEKILISKLEKILPERAKEAFKNRETAPANPYKMDKKSRMMVHWPVFDKDGKEVLLSVADADVWFKVQKATVKAANDMNMNIYAGETFGLVGESGSGKTTISRAILGINKLRKGGIYWKGFLISSGLNKTQSKRIKKSIQMIFQDPAACLNERANVDYIVSEGLYNFHLFKNKEERLNKVTQMLREVGLLPEHLSRYPHEFSGGQRQRIGIARALVIEPELVLADEPISALDVSIRAQVLNLLKKLQKENELTYLFIAHDLSIIRYISDRIAVMHNGFIVELGLAEDIYSNPLHPYTKSLLTAIPQPDPKSKDKRKKLVYEQGDLDYGKCHFEELKPNHFVLVNDELKEKIVKNIKK